MTVALTLPREQFSAPLGSVELRVMALEVTDAATLEVAAQILQEVKGWRRQIEADCRPRARGTVEHNVLRLRSGSVVPIRESFQPRRRRAPDPAARMLGGIGGLVLVLMVGLFAAIVLSQLTKEPLPAAPIAEYQPEALR